MGGRASVLVLKRGGGGGWSALSSGPAEMRAWEVGGPASVAVWCGMWNVVWSVRHLAHGHGDE